MYVQITNKRHRSYKKIFETSDPSGPDYLYYKRKGQIVFIGDHGSFGGTVYESDCVVFNMYKCDGKLIRTPGRVIGTTRYRKLRQRK